MNKSIVAAEPCGRVDDQSTRLRTGGVAQLELLDAAEELAAAKANPEGAWLSPAAQALYEAEGAARFARYHPVGRRSNGGVR